ncbi:helix-turn-helix transcriptional regulator [Enterobacter huaxiensis]
MDTSRVILSRCNFSNIGLRHLLSSTFQQEKIITFDDQKGLYDWANKNRKDALFTIYLVLPDSIYSNIIYFHWLISLRRKTNNKAISEIIITYHSDIFPELFSCICSHYKHRLININSLSNEEIIKKMHSQRHPSKNKIVKKHIELTHMEFCVLKLMIAGYTIDDISTVHNIKPKTTYTYTNNIMKQLGFNSLKKIYSCGEIIKASIEHEIIREKKKYYSRAGIKTLEPQVA